MLRATRRCTANGFMVCCWTWSFGNDLRSGRACCVRPLPHCSVGLPPECLHVACTRRTERDRVLLALECPDAYSGCGKERRFHLQGRADDAHFSMTAFNWCTCTDMTPVDTLGEVHHVVLQKYGMHEEPCQLSWQGRGRDIV